MKNLAEDKVIAIIPARGGSKGIPRKNLIDLCGKPLIAYTIEAALEAHCVDRVLVTTDDEEIASVARQYGADAPFLRPAELASDTAKTIDAIVHAIDFIKKEGRPARHCILLQATSPLRTSQQIDEAYMQFLEDGAQGLVSLCPVEEHPILMRTMDESHHLKPVLSLSSTVRRQDMPKYYRVNGAIYINKVENITPRLSFNDNPTGFLMDQTSSIDIDEWSDFERATLHLKSSRTHKTYY